METLPDDTLTLILLASNTDRWHRGDEFTPYAASLQQVCVRFRDVTRRMIHRCGINGSPGSSLLLLPCLQKVSIVRAYPRATPLSALPALRSLCIRYQQTGGDFLLGLTQLTSLHLCPIPTPASASLLTLINLRKLTLVSFPEQCMMLSVLVNLRKLTLVRCDVSPDALVTLTNLQKLRLQYGTTGCRVALRACLTQLTALDLRENAEIRDEDLQNLCGLRRLSVIDCMITNVGVSRLTTLTSLSCSRAFTDAVLGALPNLSTLNASSMWLSDATLVTLTALTHLTLWHARSFIPSSVESLTQLRLLHFECEVPKEFAHLSCVR